MKIPFSCPTCHGQKTVQKPPWIAGDQGTWVASNLNLYPCPTCDASGIVLIEDCGIGVTLESL